MRFWHYLQHGAISTLTFFVVMLTIIALPVSAQTTPTESPASSWETAEADAPLTLVWQTEFTPEAMLLTPADIAIDQDGNIYATTQSGNTVKKFDSDGNLVTSWGGAGDGDGEFSLSFAVGVDSNNNVYVSDFYNKRIQKFNNDGTFLMEWPNEPSTSPAFMAIDAQDNIYIDEFPPHGEHYIQKFDTEGNLLSEWGNDDKYFGGRIEDIAVDLDGNLYVADPILRRIQKLDPNGELLATFGGEHSRDGNGLFMDPFGIAVDKDGYIYVLDSNFLQKLDWEGNFVAQWSTKGGDLDGARNVAVDADGYIYVFAKADVTAANGNPASVLLLKKFQQAQS
jgi:DNA-binding beta-propeller fold protein YncE